MQAKIHNDSIFTIATTVKKQLYPVLNRLLNVLW
uniref:Uncharacterized protein n=1 Tax=Anguilla anguilla TaxID=7936 RepID=A0A0E9SF20_ANGAN